MSYATPMGRGGSICNYISEAGPSGPKRGSKMNIKKARKAIEAHYYEWLGVRLSNISDDDVMAEIDNLKRRGRDVFGLENCSGLFYRLHKAGVMTYDDLEKGE